MAMDTTMPFPAKWRLWHGVLCACVLLALAVGAASSGSAGGSSSGGFGTRAKAAILMDADTGAILFQHNADELLPPASITKLMTAEIVFQAIKDGRLKLEDELPMSVHAWRTGGAPSRTSSMFVPVNTTATVDQLLRGMIIQSANDAAIAFAEGMAGTEEAFAKRMNVEAKRIGLTKSTFKNPHGLYDPEHLMTAREIAMLADYIIKNHPRFYKIFSEPLFEYRRFKFRNRNPLIFMDIGADGVKTGMVKESGYNLVGSAVQNGKRLIGVVLGMPTSKDSAAETRRLLEWGFNSFAPVKLYDEGETVGMARVWGGESFYVPLVGNGPVTVILPRIPTNPRLKGEITYDGPLKPPIKKGDKVATLRVTSETKTVNEVPLYAGEDVQPGGLVRRGLDSLAHLAFGWVL
jgi:serine-type D-Ala-D-Ala carboxypeptidase (penicillin-binding protein 5/6)